MVTSAVLPSLSSLRWNGREYIGGETVEVDSHIYSDSQYLTVYYDGEFAMCNVKTLRIKMAALTDTNFLAGGIPQVIAGDETPEHIEASLDWSEEPFPTNLYKWFESQEERRAESHVRSLMVNGAWIANSSSRDFFHNHSKLLVVIDNENPGNYVDDYSVAHSIFTDEVRTDSSSLAHPMVNFSSYVIYASQRTTVYAVQLPA